MYRIAIIFVLFCCFAAPPGMAQLSTNQLHPGNVNTVYQDIERSYANRIDIPLHKVKTFLQATNSFPYMGALPVPQAEVVLETDPVLRLNWPDLPKADGYHIRYLHLSNGQQNSQSLDASHYSLSGWDNGLTIYLVSARFSGRASAEYIIIDEKIIAFDLTTVENCLCERGQTIYYQQFKGVSIGERLSNIINDEDFDHNGVYRVKWGFNLEDNFGSTQGLFDTEGRFFMGYEDLTDYQRLILFANNLGNCFQNTEFYSNEDQIYGMDNSGEGFLAFSYTPFFGFTMDWLQESQEGFIHIAKCARGNSHLPDYSKFREEEVENNSLILPTIFPNPVNSELNLQFHLPQTSEVRLSLYDAQGRQQAIDFPTAMQAAGPQQYHLTVEHLAPGWYFGQLQYGAQSENIRFFKVE